MPEQNTIPQAALNELRTIIISVTIGQLHMIADQWEHENRFAHCGYYVADLRAEADALERGDLPLKNRNHACHG